MLVLRYIAREFCLQFFREGGGGRLNVGSEDFEQERQSSICRNTPEFKLLIGHMLEAEYVVILTTDWLKRWGGFVPRVEQHNTLPQHLQCWYIRNLHVVSDR